MRKMSPNGDREPRRLSRRTLLKMFGIGAAGLGLAGCKPESTPPTGDSKPLEKATDIPPTATLAPTSTPEATTPVPTETPISFVNPEIMIGVNSDFKIVTATFKLGDRVTPDFAVDLEEKGWDILGYKEELAARGQEFCDEQPDLCKDWTGYYARIEIPTNSEDGQDGEVFEVGMVEDMAEGWNENGKKVSLGLLSVKDNEGNFHTTAITTEYGKEEEGTAFWRIKPVHIENGIVTVINQEIMSMRVGETENNIYARPFVVMTDEETGKSTYGFDQTKDPISLVVPSEDQEHRFDFPTYLASVGGKIGDELFKKWIPSSVMAEGPVKKSQEEIDEEKMDAMGAKKLRGFTRKFMSGMVNGKQIVPDRVEYYDEDGRQFAQFIDRDGDGEGSYELIGNQASREIDFIKHSSFFVRLNKAGQLVEEDGVVIETDPDTVKMIISSKPVFQDFGKGQFEERVGVKFYFGAKGVGGEVLRSPVNGEVTKLSVLRKPDGSYDSSKISIKGEDGIVYIFYLSNIEGVSMGDKYKIGDPIMQIPNETIEAIDAGISSNKDMEVTFGINGERLTFDNLARTSDGRIIILEKTD